MSDEIARPIRASLRASKYEERALAEPDELERYTLRVHAEIARQTAVNILGRATDGGDG